MILVSGLLVLAWRNAGWWGLDRFALPALGTPWHRGEWLERRGRRAGRRGRRREADAPGGAAEAAPPPSPADGDPAGRAARRRSGGSVGGGCRRGGSSASRSAVASATWRTARSNAASVAAEVFWTPLTLRTYWRAAASISSGVAGGPRPPRVGMLRHMGARLPVPPQVLLDLGGEQAERAGDPVAGQLALVDEPVHVPDREPEPVCGLPGREPPVVARLHPRLRSS